ncbi:MAG: recombinase family protein, partial [Desulfococcaceae bacterium]|nr:recombinase family protein [Desulfococcaceae bacterium]
KTALQHKKAKGEKTGGDVPFGFDLDEGGRLRENENEQKALRLMKSLKEKGYSLRAIGRELEKEGITTKKGKSTWNPKTLSAILKRAA